MRSILLPILAVAVVALLAYLALWPVPVAPVAWQPPPAPGLDDPYAVNDALAAIQRLAEGLAAGPEDVAVDAQGRVYAGYADGSIRRFDPPSGGGVILANTSGRPLGLDWAPDGSLIIADAVRGLLALRPDGRLETLVTAAAGVPLGFADDVDVAADGSVYFSDASTRWGMHEHRAAILEHAGTGRLIRYEPKSGETTVLLDGLYFANGVAVGPHERFVLVNETGAYRITRYWLAGPKKGTSDLFYANLPGFPDGISHNGEGLFWVALFAPRSAALDALAPYPWLRKVVYRLPAALQPQPAPRAFALGIDAHGKLVHNLQDTGAEAYAPITSVEQVGKRLYFGSLGEDAIGVMAAPR